MCCVVYSGAALTHLNRLDQFQARVENVCGFTFQSLTDRRNTSILGLTCHLLAGEGRGNLQTFCPQFKTPLRSSQWLRGFDPASHLRFQNPCTFHTLDRFRRSWQAAVVDLWDSIPPNILLEGHTNGWRTVLQNIQRYNDSIITVYIAMCCTFLQRGLQNVKKNVAWVWLHAYL